MSDRATLSLPPQLAAQLRASHGGPAPVESWEAEEVVPPTPISSLPEHEHESLSTPELQAWEESNEVEVVQVREDAEQDIPVVVVCLDSICGFTVAEDDKEAIGSKLEESLREDFEGRVEELFEIGAGWVSTKLCSTALMQELERDRRSYYCVPYPPEVGGEVVSQLWEEITSPSKFNSVQVIKQFLQPCGRSLIWKQQMCFELERMALSCKEEHLAERRREEAAMAAWDARRRGELRSLIEARPMFVERLQKEEKKIEALGEGEGRGKAVNPISAAIIAQLEVKIEQIDDLVAEMEVDEHEAGRGYISSDQEDEEGWEEDDMWWAKEPEDEGDQEQLLLEEAGLEGDIEHHNGDGAEKSKSAAVNGVKRKGKKKKKKRASLMQNVANKKPAAAAAATPKHEEIKAPASLTVIDEVAAMVLGRYPRKFGASDEEHFKYLAMCHQEIRTSWITEMGALPDNDPDALPQPSSPAKEV
ncbi:unnamed protein product [Chrysoparadoxa australica]